MLKEIHGHIIGELSQNSRTDTIFFAVPMAIRTMS